MFVAFPPKRHNNSVSLVAKGSMTIESMNDEDIKRIMKARYTMIGTDGSSVAPTGPLGMVNLTHGFTEHTQEYLESMSEMKG